ncbi:hypothetical protein R6Q57_016019 [Mikania cordata]
MKPVEKVVIKPNLVSKPVIKPKTTATHKLIVFSSEKVNSKPFGSSKYYDEPKSKTHLQRTCYRCGKVGHLISDCGLDFSSTDCTNLRYFSPRETRKCFTCCGKGHISANCPNNRIKKCSDDESWVKKLGGSLRKVKPNEEEMRVLRKFDPDCVWVKEEKNQQKRIFDHKKNVKKIVKMVTSSDDDFFDKFSSKSFSKKNGKSKSFWKLRCRSGDQISGKKDDNYEDGSSSSSSQQNGKSPFRETQRRSGVGRPF